MDITSLAFGAIAISTGVIGWDILSRRNATEPLSEGHRNLAELAYYVLFISAFGLLVILKLMTFAGVLFSATVLTGLVWVWDARFSSKARAKERKEPIFVEISRGFFPIILIVFLLRSFLFEPFKIPSGSMIPSLLVGDFILVNKFTFGIRLPVINKKIVEMNQPKRGDVMVFRFPEDTTIDYIKRVIGVPGDRVEYRHKQLIINGQPVPTTQNGHYISPGPGFNSERFELYTEKLADHEHKTITIPELPPVDLARVRQFPGKENCTYNDDGFICTVPAGHYFMMGDNRDGSADSRYWGFVPDENIVGKAFLIWWNAGDYFIGDLKRIGNGVDGS